MAYSSDYKRAIFKKDSARLIKAITNFEETEENFQLCLDFTLSNLLFHSYLDVDGHKVKRSISGLHEKYLVHSDLEKARRFKLLADHVFEIIEAKYGSEKEVLYSILDLLLRLSQSNIENSQKEALETLHERTVDKTIFDWVSYLKEDDIKYCLSDSNSEEYTSESDEESADEIEGADRALLHPPPRDDSGLGISPDSCSGSSQKQFQVNNVCVPVSSCDAVRCESQMDSKLFHLYWISKHQRTFSSNPYPLKTMNFTKIWEEHIADQDSHPSIVKKVMMHERNIIKETLWMLTGEKDLFLFQWNDCEYVVNPVVHTCNITAVTLTSVLNEYCAYGAKFVSLETFVSNVLVKGPESINFCRTFHAYAAALQKLIQKLRDSFCDLEKRIRIRRETFTLLSLQEKCKSIFEDLDVLYQLNQKITKNVAQDCNPLEKSCRLLNILWEQLTLCRLKEANSSSVKLVLTIFLETCRPFFIFMESLIIFGNLEDPHQEFICSRNGSIPVSDEEFWESGLTLKSLPADVFQDFFLQHSFKDIVIAGKSIEILNRMNSLMNNKPFRLNIEKGDLFHKFIHILQKQMLGCSKKIYCVKKTESPVEKAHPLRDPLLIQKIFEYQPSTKKFFCPGVNPVYLPVAIQVHENLFTEKQMKTQSAIDSLSAPKWKSLTKCILRAFDLCMKFAYYPTCNRLVKALKEKYNLMMHMEVMQKYFLMESGDLMFSFYSKVFEKIFYKEPWQDVSFLYSVLQNAISDDKTSSESLCIFLEAPNTEVQLAQPLSQLISLQLSYNVEWPVNMMLGSSVQNQYSQIFSFLLQIKCAKYLLDQLCFMKLKADGNEPKSKLSSLMSKFVIPRNQKIHGMYVIRMRLMFFVNGLHNYIMTRILHSFGIEFNENLREAHTVDEMIQAHHCYLKSLHERCFLDKRLPYLKEQILLVLNLCYSFQQLWLKGVDSVSLEDLEQIEKQFSQYSYFLFSYFNTPLRRGVYIHLESLVSSMLSDTHSFHVFKNQKSIPSSNSYDQLKR